MGNAEKLIETKGEQKRTYGNKGEHRKASENMSCMF
jgi:hypothetical protein